MKPFLPPTALRAARALVGLSQIDAAQEAGVAVKSLRAAEVGTTVSGDVNAKLRELYEEKGLEFLGIVDVGSGEMCGIGARWRDPQTVGKSLIPTVYKSLENEVCLDAARAFLGKTLAEVSEETAIEMRAIRGAENGNSVNLNVREQLLRYYRGKGIVLLGRRDVLTNLYVGVGVMEDALENAASPFGDNARFSLDLK